MFGILGGFFGWALVYAFAGTILNYILKFVNKRFSKKIATFPKGKRIMKLLMTIFVRNHKYFGFATVALLIAHFAAEFSRFGINMTGAIAASLMVLQVLLGLYANIRKRPRKGLWFVAHRSIALLIVLGISIHLIFPYAIKAPIMNIPTNNPPASVDTSHLPTFMLEELANYNGEHGNKAYVAYNGIVYDVTDNPSWRNGNHHGQKAGTDLTEAISFAPHGDSVFEGLTIVGRLE